jgi:hypothetical protein
MAARAFMRDLARIINPEFWEKTAEAYEAMIPMLTDVPTRCWKSRQCLEAVALAPRKVRAPNIGDLRVAIFQWVRDNPDGTARLPDPNTQGWDTMDHQWWAYWLLRSKHNFDKVKTPGAEFERTTRAHVLSLVRSKSPKAFARIVQDLEAFAEAEDKAWWTDRLDRLEATKHPTNRWREGMGMWEILSREGGHPRPEVRERLDRIIDEAEMAGADTNPKMVRGPNTALADAMLRLARYATPRREHEALIGD